MSPSQLKAAHLAAVPDSHFFDRDTMRHWGDYMSNYGCRAVEVVTHERETVPVWELYRKRPVKYGLRESAYFRRDTFTILHGIAEAPLSPLTPRW